MAVSNRADIMTLRQIRETVTNGNSGIMEEVFWLGTSSREPHEMEVVVRFNNLASWILADCKGNPETIREKITHNLQLMEYQILNLIGISTEEDRKRIGVSVWPPEPQSRNASESTR